MPSAPALSAAGERKFAVLVFADLTGYTDLCRRLDPEDVAATVRPVMAEMKRAVEVEGGLVPSIAGDGFMAVFGVPVARFDVAACAVRAATRLRDIVTESNAEQRSYRIPDVHVGIAAGEVLVLPSEESVGWSLVGNAVNLASRLCDAAEPGEVLVDEEVRRLVADTVWSGERHIEVRGAHTRIPAWSLGAGPGTEPYGGAPVLFVNRVDTVRWLDSGWEETQALSVSRTLLVAGETGIGKSRLLRHWLTERRHAQVWVWCGAQSAGSGLARIVEGMETAAPAVTSDAMLLWQNATAQTAGALRGDPFPAALAAARAVTEAAIAAVPCVIVVDDAHLADASVQAFLRDVRERPLRGAALIVATWRNDESEPPWPADVELKPLSAEDTAELIRDALGAQPSAELTAAISARVGGHPLMTLQSTAYLLESGAVDVGADGCALRSPDAIETLPTSLRLFVAARIDRLPTPEKVALQELSTFGERISRSAVERLTGQHITAAVPALVRRGLLRETGEGWRFSHGLMQQVSYASLPRSVRAELHRRQWQAQPPEQTGERVYHASRWADCVTSTDQAQQRAAVGAALSAAYAHALELSATQSAAAHDAVRAVAALIDDHMLGFAREVADLLTLDSQSLLEMGRFEPALHAADRALDAVADLDPRSSQRLQALLARGHALSRLRRFQAARQALDDAMTLAESVDEPVMRGTALRLLGDTWRHESFSQFLALTEEAHDVFSRAGADAQANECACILAYLLSTSTSPRYERWRAAAEATVTGHDVRGQAWLARTDMWAGLTRRDLATAGAAASAAVRFGEMIGAADSIADGLTGVALAATALGRLEDAIAAFERLRRQAVAVGNPRTRLVAASAGAQALLRAGRLAEAVDELSTALAALEGFGLGEALDVTMTAARVALDRGQWAVAARHCDAAHESAVAGGYVLSILEARLLQSRIYQQLGPAPTSDYLRLLVTDCESAPAPQLASWARALLEAATLDGTGPPAAAAEPEELAIRADTAALLAEQMGTGAKAAWQEAARRWQVLGTTVWLARAQARSGDPVAAASTLRAVGADDSAPAWTLA